MIITSDYTILSNSDFPKTDWTGVAKYVIPDGSFLANKITNSLNSNIVYIEDENGNLIDIQEAKLPLDELKKLKIDELYAACNEKIALGIDFKGKHYSLTSDNQMNLIRNFGLAQIGLDVYFQADGEYFAMLTSNEFIEIYNACFSYIAEQMSKFNSLKIQINAMEDSELVKELLFI